MNNFHCIPVGNGEPTHECHTRCWCYPVLTDVSKNIYAHNAKDCREKWERQGIKKPGQSLWVVVEEKVEQLECAGLDGTLLPDSHRSNAKSSVKPEHSKSLNTDP